VAASFSETSLMTNRHVIMSRRKVVIWLWALFPGFSPWSRGFELSPCGGQSVTGTGFSASTLILPYRYHSTIAP
jgi:hypothetical protein